MDDHDTCSLAGMIMALRLPSAKRVMHGNSNASRYGLMGYSGCRYWGGI